MLSPSVAQQRFASPRTLVWPACAADGCFLVDRKAAVNEAQRYAKRLSYYVGRFHRNQQFQCRPVRVRPAMATRFAATCGFALGLLAIKVKISPKLYSQIITDGRISHGAFRLWHYLRDRHGKNPSCWPSLRRICADIKCGKAAMLGWTKELVAAGYMTVEPGTRTRSNHYSVSGSTQNHVEVLPETTGGSESRPIGGSKPSHELNSGEPNSKNLFVKALSPSERFSLERERKEKMERLSHIRAPYADSEIIERRALKERLSKIDAALHVKL